MVGALPLPVIIDYWLLSIALLLLWFPRQWLRAGERLVELPNVRRKLSKGRDPRDQSLPWREEVFRLRNWIDLGRALIGGIAVVHVCFEAAPDAPRTIGLVLLLTKAAILLVAILVQTIRLESGRLTLFAPVFFSCGLAIPLLGWMPAVFAFVMTWTISRALHGPGMFLFAFAGLQSVFAHLMLSASPPIILLSAGLTWTPVLVSAIFRRRLERAGKRASSGRW